MTHEEIQELIPLLAIDALPAAEAALVRMHLATCATCKQLYAETENVAGALLAGVPAVEPPASIAANLRQRVPAPRRVADPARALMPNGMPVRQRWAWLGVALVVLALLAVGVYSILPQNDDAPDVEMAQLAKTPGIVNISIKATDTTSKSWGRVVANPDSATGYLMVAELSTLPPQQTYQVWLTRDAERSSAAVFTVDTTGKATVRLHAPDAIRNYREVGVTVEPAGGSPWPTTARIIGGALAQK